MWRSSLGILLVFVMGLTAYGQEAQGARKSQDISKSQTADPVGEERKVWDLEGELRQQAVYQNVLDFGIEESDSLQQLLSRLRLQLSYHPSPGWDLHLGVGNSLAWGTLDPAPNDQDPLFLEQGWLGAPFGPGNSQLKAGRQLVSLGSGRLVSARLGPNVPLSFDGLRYHLDQNSFDLDLLALSPVRNNNKALGDNSGTNTLWGAYATRPWDDTNSADFYFLGTHRENLRLAGRRGTDDRYSLGARFFGHNGAWDYNHELVYQGGSFENQAIAAWTVATDNGWTLGEEGGWRPRLGVKLDVASGDKRGRTAGTFHPLYPNFSYFSEAALISPSNLIDFNPNISVHPSERQTVVLGWDFLWRYSNQDGLYVPPGIELFPAEAGKSSRIGDQISLLYQNQVSDSVEFEVGFTHFRAGPYLKEAGGESTTFLVTSWTLDF